MIDIREINSIRYSVGIRFLEGGKAGFLVKKNIYTGILNYIYSLFQSIFINPLSFKKIGECNEGSLILYSSKNQLNALEPLHKILEIENNHCIISTKELPFIYSYISSLNSIGDFIRYYKQSTSEERRIIGNEFCAFLRSYGDYKLFLRLFKKKRPKILIVANDHSSTFRAALLAAKEVKIKTLYVQHAAVTNKFPKMIFNYAFLDGYDAYCKYREKGIESDSVFLIGGVRFDISNRKEKKRTGDFVIGVALTLKDTEEEWQKTIAKLKEEYAPNKILLRPHPGMNVARIYEYSKNEGIGFSDSRSENSFDFISNIDFLLANETSIHLDAAIMHTPSVVCSCLSNKKFTDHYGFVKTGIVERIKDIKEVLPYIKNYHFSPSVESIRRYNASYNTSVEGSVSSIICSFIRDTISGAIFYDERLNNKDSIYTIK